MYRGKQLTPSKQENMLLLSCFLFNFFYRKYGRFTAAICKIIPMNFFGRIAEIISYKIQYLYIIIFNGLEKKRKEL